MPDFDFSTVIFALVALFVVFKFRSVLGTRKGSERPSGGLLAPLRRAPGSGPSVAPPTRKRRPPLLAAPADRWKGVAEPDGVWTGLDAIVAADRSFLAGRPFCPARGSHTIWSSTDSLPATPRRFAT